MIPSPSRQSRHVQKYFPSILTGFHIEQIQVNILFMLTETFTVFSNVPGHIAGCGKVSIRFWLIKTPAVAAHQQPCISYVSTAANHSPFSAQGT